VYDCDSRSFDPTSMLRGLIMDIFFTILFMESLEILKLNGDVL